LANLLDRFNKTVVGSKGRIADYAPVISVSGDFKLVTDLNAILLSWNNILLTPTRSYDHDPEYGCDLYKMIFDQADSVTEDNIRNEIINKLPRYDDRASITDVNVFFLNNKKGFVVNVLVNYKGVVGKLEARIDESLYFQFMG